MTNFLKHLNKKIWFALIFFGVGIANATDQPPAYVLNYFPNSSIIKIVGDISPSLLVEFKKIPELEKFKRLIITSGGGDVDSAIELANIVKNKEMKLVVDGICASSCANYLFIGAKTKIVRQNSFIAIHGSAHGGSNIYLRFNPDRESPIKETIKREQDFFRSLGMNLGLLKVYDDFVDKVIDNGMIKKILDGSGGEECPPLKGWSPTEDELISWGVKGIEKYWYPKTSEDIKLIHEKINADMKIFFWGTSNDLNRLCLPQN
ncbi:MAG: hypothetical protein NVS3B3_16350 [Aquirhabdus sp.]